MAQWVKDRALSLLWLRSLLWCKVGSLAWEFPHAAEGLAKKIIIIMEEKLNIS